MFVRLLCLSGGSKSDKWRVNICETVVFVWRVNVYQTVVFVGRSTILSVCVTVVSM